MNRLAAHALIAGLFLCCLVTPPARCGTPEEAVTEAFNGYKNAILGDRGADAAVYLSSNTVQYYEEMRDLALYACEAELRERSTIDLMQVLVMRHRIPADSLQQMNGVELLTHALNNGWIGKESVTNLSVQSVGVLDDVAALQAISDRETLPTQLRFVRENDAWKLDLMPLMRSASALFEGLAREREMTREEFILAVLSSIGGSVVDNSIWTPPLQRDAAD